ncbi:MAG: iron chaperone [Chloroflexota bacterium]
MSKPETIEEYLAELAPEARAALEGLRATANAAAPEATESIAYDMPALRSHGGQFLVSYAAFKNHYSLFPASDQVVKTLGAELTPYLAGKGTIRFPASRPIPLDLVRRIVEIRVKENASGERR